MKNFFHLILATGFLSIILAGCNNDPGFPETPQLEFVSISPDTVVELVDSILIQFRFTDGNGDLGNEDNLANNLTVIDNRVNADTDPITLEQATLKYTIPWLTPNTKNPAIQGTVNLEIVNTARRLGYQEDFTTFNIQVVDRSGNESNVITTSPITIVR